MVCLHKLSIDKNETLKSSVETRKDETDPDRFFHVEKSRQQTANKINQNSKESGL